MYKKNQSQDEYGKVTRIHLNTSFYYYGQEVIKYNLELEKEGNGSCKVGTRWGMQNVVVIVIVNIVIIVVVII